MQLEKESKQSKKAPKTIAISDKLNASMDLLQLSAESRAQMVNLEKLLGSQAANKILNDAIVKLLGIYNT